MKPDLVFGFENAGWPAMLVDRSITILKANQAAIQVFGPQILGNAKLSAIWSQENPTTAQSFLERWERQPAASNVLKFNVRGINVSYTVVVCGVKDGPDQLFILQLFPDIGTGLGSVEGAQSVEGTMQKQKLEVAIKLARSVALDFKNALGGVLGHSSLLLMSAEPDHPWRKALLEIERAVARGAEAASSLSAFGRPASAQQQRPGSASLNTVLQKAAESMETAAQQRSVRWEFQLERRLFMARFDESKVQQALVKIIENAFDAMINGGTVRLATRNLELSQQTQDRTAKLPAGAYVCAEITDTGSGIEAAILPRIFEPFFTTKSSSKHRGLGLPWVYGIITNLGGGVAVSSEVGVGTSVRVYLPADNSMVSEPTGTTVELRGTETVLLVDDEEIILSMGEAVLTSFGYKVLTAPSGAKALEILKRPGTKVDLLVTDLVMPAMSGTELVEQVQKLLPDMRVIITSGALTGTEQSNNSYLPKPFTSQQLLEKVRSMLPSAKPAE